jgi:hypothetical protein
MIWGTLNREKLLNKTAAKHVSRYLDDYAETAYVYLSLTSPA